MRSSSGELTDDVQKSSMMSFRRQLLTVCSRTSIESRHESLSSESEAGEAPSSPDLRDVPSSVAYLSASRLASMTSSSSLLFLLTLATESENLTTHSTSTLNLSKFWGLSPLPPKKSMTPSSFLTNNPTSAFLTSPSPTAIPPDVVTSSAISPMQVRTMPKKYSLLDLV